MGLFGDPNVDKLKEKRDQKGLLKALVYKSNPAIRMAAAQALGEMGDAQATPSLLTAVEDTDSTVRVSAAEALDRLNWQPAKDAIGASYWMAKNQWMKCTEIGLPAVSPLMRALNDSNPEVRQAAAGTLVQMRTVALEPLLAALGDAAQPARIQVAGILGEIGDAKAVEPLIAALHFIEHKDLLNYCYYMLWKVATAISKNPIPSQLKPTYEPSVEKYIQNNNLRCAAANALGKIGDERALAPLYAVLNGEGTYPTMLLRWCNRFIEAKRLKKDKFPQEFLLEAIDNAFGHDLEQAVQNAIQQIGASKTVEPSFAHNDDRGSCGVCGCSVRSKEGYLVPKDIFFESYKYHDWLQTEPSMQNEIQQAGGVEAYLKKKKEKEPIPFFLVCPECIGLFASITPDSINRRMILMLAAAAFEGDYSKVYA